MAHKNFWLAIALLWTSIIFYLCLIDSSELPSLGIKVEGFDKVVHFSFHFIFTVFWVIYLNVTNTSVTRKQVTNVIIASFLIGVTIEFLQGEFTTTRNADIIDVLANSLGTVTSGFIMYFIVNRINKLKTQ
ncbi:VanZ family protein [Flavobacterium capsici]|uniref:VanZ family protein n=1 Tax=Flavobacterium capsici TaxID=3075618 RepID=A0AA96EVN5_9FLAO|nr:MULTISPECIES: VanZ family protein [unclassified Flavobacterium]WNM19344.1 VanZ family protein [Flavobacterium sp. PMR2A8]WNM20733.1 VanZ family protein [Flavobacterium sp. PMTSA4]